MNAEVLLKHFDRISDAPDALPRLRQFVLDLAVRGKLVEQDPNDEPASELLERIEAEKTRLVKAGELRKSMPLPPVEEDKVPFGAPATWEWVRIRQVTSDRGQKTPDRDFTYIDVTAINKEAGFVSDPKVLSPAEAPSRARKLVQTGDVLYSCVRPYLLNIAVIEGDIDPPPIASTAFAVLNGFNLVQSRYLWIVLRSPFMVEAVEARMRGQAYPAINDSDFSLLPFPLPPLADQHRIVAKVQELIALCDRFEEAKKEREARRDRLAAASLYRLNNGAVDLRESARFFISHLPRLTIHPGQVKTLRQTILNLAVRGQLVSQESNDEPALELLRRIQAEKARLFKEGRIRKSDAFPLPSEADFPFPLPAGWAASNLESLCISITDGDHLPPPKADKGIPFLVIGNVRNQSLTFDGCRHVSEEYYNALDAIRRPKSGDILYTLVGSYGIPVRVTDDRPFCVQRHIGILRPSQAFSVSYLSWVLESRWVFDQATTCATGIAQKTVPLSGLRRISIPLAPLGEQRRIVAKVDELMALCDRLERQITDMQTESSNLLEAVLHKALIPGSVGAQ